MFLFPRPITQQFSFLNWQHVPYTFAKIFILHLLILKQPNENLGFKYLNEIGVKNEHFGFATLRDK